MLLLFEKAGGGIAEKAIDKVSVLPERPQSLKSMFLYLKGFREMGQTL